VVVKQLPPGARRDEFQRIGAPKIEENLSQKKQQTENETPIVKSREREVADRKLEELYSVIDEVFEEKDADQSGFFRTLDTDDGEILVPTNSTLSHLSDAVSKVVNMGCFPTVSAARILSIQSLCEPLITATSQQSLHIDGSDDDEFVDRLHSAQAGLRACKLILQTMTEGRDDRRICSEDLVQSLIRLGKQVLNSCITPVVESRRSGLSSELFAIASHRKNDIYPVLRLCGSIFTQVAALIGKIKLSGFTLSPIESMCIDVIFAENGAKETESVLGIQKFEAFRQKAMDLLAQTFACHPDQRDSIAGEVLNNLERLPDKRANARQFKSAREAPIMLVSALFMRIVQAAGSNNSEKVEVSEQASAADSDGDDDKDDSDSEADELAPKQRKPANRLGQTPNQIVSRLWSGASMTAGHIATTLVNRAENVSKSGDKPFRNLLDLFIEDLCNVLGSPEWPAASLFLEKLLAIMVNYAQNQKERGVQAADMALAAIGSMGVGIIDFLTRLKQHKRSLDVSQSELASKLAVLAEDALRGDVNKSHLLDLNGPFRILLESLPGYLSPQGAHASRDEPHTRSLSGYLVTSWVNTFYGAFKEKDDEPRSQAVSNLERHLQKVVMDPNWFSKE
jgi:cohesin loading factor subunit SCC2